MRPTTSASARGGLVLCEDGDGDDFIHGLTLDSETFPFANWKSGAL